MKYSIEEIEDIKKSFKEFNINDNVKCKINTLVISLKQNKKTMSPRNLIDYTSGCHEYYFKR